MNKIALATLLVALGAGGVMANDEQRDKLLADLPAQIDLPFYRDDASGEWNMSDREHYEGKAQCKATFAALDKAKVPGTTMVTLQKENPILKAGAHPLSAVRKACEHIEHHAKIKAWERWAFLSVQESARIGSGKYYDLAFFERCVEYYDAMTKAGVLPTERVLEQDIHAPGGNGTMRWAGTVEELRIKYCDIGLKKVQAEMAAKFAPYKKALKADKLAMVIPAGANAIRAYILPGGAVSSDAKKLASAKVWFSDTQGVNAGATTCGDGSAPHVVHRYQFDAKHKLIKTTDKQYCGAVPKSAYKK